MQKYIVAMVYFLVAASYCTAQKEPESTLEYKQTVCSSHYNAGKVQLPVNDESVIHWLTSFLPNLKQFNSDVHLLCKRVTPVSQHYSFVQTYKGSEVFQSDVKVNVSSEGEVLSVYDNSYDTRNWNVAMPSIESAYIVLGPSSNEPQIVTKSTDAKGIVKFVSASNVVYSYDANMYRLAPDSLVTGRIFLPDPLTTANKVYGGIYIDDNDLNSTWLSNELKEVDFLANYNAGVFSLDNAYIQLADLDLPTLAPVTSNTPVFNFNRSQSGFEDVNVFYHLSSYRQYVHSLGFSLADNLLLVDPHGGTADNSYFSYTGFTPQIFYGIGGVDDAEDADVIVHEYGHFLAHNASPNSNFGTERKSIDEGNSDYLAGGYSKTINPFNSDWVFNWDGHNAFWSGRVLNTAKVYPADVSSSIYRNGEIWSAALTAIAAEIGRPATDSLVLQSMYFLSSNMSMADAAKSLLQADTLLTGGKYFCPVYRQLYLKGFVPFVANACGINSVEELNNVETWEMVTSNECVKLSRREPESVKVSIIDISGRIIHQLSLFQSDIQYCNDQLPAGIYIVQVQSSGRASSFKWQKSK